MVDEAIKIRAAANQCLANRLLSLLSSYQPDNLPENRGRFVLTCRISSCRLQDRRLLSYCSNNTLGELLGLLAHVAFLANNEKAGADIIRISEAVQGRYNSLVYRSRQAFRARYGVAVLVLFKDNAEVRLSPPFTASVRAFLSGNMSCTSAEG